MFNPGLCQHRHSGLGAFWFEGFCRNLAKESRGTVGAGNFFESVGLRLARFKLKQLNQTVLILHQKVMGSQQNLPSLGRGDLAPALLSAARFGDCTRYSLGRKLGQLIDLLAVCRVVNRDCVLAGREVAKKARKAGFAHSITL